MGADHLANLRSELIALGPWLEETVGLVGVSVVVPNGRPVSATFVGRGNGTNEPFQLALTVALSEVRLHNLWIPVSTRGKGRGRAIINAVVALARRHAIAVIVVEPRPSSEGFWKAVGFIPDKRNGLGWSLRIP